MEQYLLDSKGERRLCETFRRDWCLPSTGNGHDDFSFAVRALGYAFLRRTPRHFTLFVNLSVISDVTLVAVIYELNDYAEHYGGVVFINYDNKIFSRFTDGYSAMRHILTQSNRGAAHQGANFVRRPISIVRGGASRNAFDQVVALCNAGATPGEGELGTILRAHFGDRYCVVRPNPEGTRLVLAAFGKGYEQIDEYSRYRQAGTPFGEFADRAYSKFVQTAYFEAWRSCRPILEVVEAPGFKPPLPSRYERLLVPLRWAHGRAMLSVTNTMPEPGGLVQFYSKSVVLGIDLLSSASDRS